MKLSDFGDKTVADSKMKKLENSKETHIVSFRDISTIDAYQPCMALRSLSNENGVSNEKGTIRGAGHIPWPHGLPDLTK